MLLKIYWEINTISQSIGLDETSMRDKDRDSLFLLYQKKKAVGLVSVIVSLSCSSFLSSSVSYTRTYIIYIYTHIYALEYWLCLLIKNTYLGKVTGWKDCRFYVSNVICIVLTQMSCQTILVVLMLNCAVPCMVVEGQHVLLFVIRESITVLFGQQINWSQEIQLPKSPSE